MSLADEIVARIDRDTLVQFALEICNIDSAVPFEAEVAEHLYQWLKREGFIARRVGLLSDSLAPPGSIIYHSANKYYPGGRSRQVNLPVAIRALSIFSASTWCIEVAPKNFWHFGL